MSLHPWSTKRRKAKSKKDEYEEDSFFYVLPEDENEVKSMLQNNYKENFSYSSEDCTNS